jgi:hypothetical protein
MMALIEGAQVGKEQLAGDLSAGKSGGWFGDASRSSVLVELC